MICSALLLLAVLAPAPQAPTAPAPEPAVTEPAVTEPAVSKSAAPEAAPARAAKKTAAAAVSTGDPIDAGLIAYKKRRFKQAEAEFSRAVEADPSSAAAQYYLGYTIYKIAEPRRPNSPGKQQAAEHFAKAFELDPGFKPSWKPRS